MGDSLAGLRPDGVWSFFAELAKIPRPSKHEQQVLVWIRSLATERGWEIVADAAGNLVLRVPPTPGHENAPTVVLQAHLDMVCEKNRDVDHDFLNDPIRPRLDGEWVYATGTTLGADNGIGVAAALAAASDPDVIHGPLELLFTIDEETGLTGARELDAGILRGLQLINLDSEEDGKLFVGCAGGADSHLELSLSAVATGPGLCGRRIEIGGLRGGHSGLNIHEKRGNAVRLMTRLLLSATHDGIDVSLAELTGGDKPNAIPREAQALIALKPGESDRLEQVVERARRDFAVELEGIDDGLRIVVHEDPAPAEVLAPRDRERLLRLLAVLPHGVLAMSGDIPELVETSSNLASVAAGTSGARVVTSTRGSLAPSREAVLESIACAGALVDARVRRDDGYPGWKPRMDSALLSVVRDVYAEVWGRPPEVTAVHAGLECGLLGEKIPEMDMISFGPQIEGAHSPDERVNVPSVERFWRALRGTLSALALDRVPA